MYGVLIYLKSNDYLLWCLYCCAGILSPHHISKIVKLMIRHKLSAKSFEIEQVQWNHSTADTIGTMKSACFIKVSA